MPPIGKVGTYTTGLDLKLLLITDDPISCLAHFPAIWSCYKVAFNPECEKTIVSYMYM